MEEKRRINVNVDHSEPAFFTDNATVWHNQNKFVLDFMQASPRFDQLGDNNQQTVVVKHKTLLMDPVMAKVFLNVLKENIEKYEKSLGKITIPKKKKAVRRGKKRTSTASKVAEATSRYIG